MSRIWKSIILIVVIIVWDQLTKYGIRMNYALGESTPVIDGLFSITYVRNPGAAFGFLATASEAIRRPLFLFIPVVACLYLMFLMWKEKVGNALLSLAYALIFAGAVGNLIDRFAFGYVVDFLDFYLGDAHFPAFNIADSAITIAACLLVLDFIFQVRDKYRNKEITIKQQ